MDTKLRELEDLHQQLETQVNRISSLIERLVYRIEGLEKRVSKNTEVIQDVANKVEGDSQPKP